MGEAGGGRVLSSWDFDTSFFPLFFCTQQLEKGGKQAGGRGGDFRKSPFLPSFCRAAPELSSHLGDSHLPPLMGLVTSRSPPGHQRTVHFLLFLFQPQHLQPPVASQPSAQTQRERNCIWYSLMLSSQPSLCRPPPQLPKYTNTATAYSVSFVNLKAPSGF